MKITCSNCTRQLNVDNKLIGARVKCNCGHAFRVADPRKKAATVQFRCTSCSKVLRTKASDAGKLVSCSCGTKLKIPAPKERNAAPVANSSPQTLQLQNALPRQVNTPPKSHQKPRPKKVHFHTVYALPAYRKMLVFFLMFVFCGACVVLAGVAYFRLTEEFQDPNRPVIGLAIMLLFAAISFAALFFFFLRHKVKIGKTAIEITGLWSTKRFSVREVAVVRIYVARKSLGRSRNMVFLSKDGKILGQANSVVGRFSQLEKWARKNFPSEVTWH